MIDGGETDWKILAVRTDDPLAQKVQNITTAPDSVKKLSDDIREWYVFNDIKNLEKKKC